MAEAERLTGHVIVIHGLGRTSVSMWWAGRQLKKAGFECTNIGYPSRRMTVEENARYVANRLPATGAQPLHFLAHSLGGIIVRYIARHFRPANLGRVVMLGPPNQGSQLASLLSDHWWYRLTTGPAGQQIGTENSSIPKSLGPVDFELGVIAGENSADPLQGLLSGLNDGKVTVDETKVAGMKDWLVVRRGHTWQMVDRMVIDQAIQFFKNGEFDRDKDIRE